MEVTTDRFFCIAHKWNGLHKKSGDFVLFINCWLEEGRSKHETAVDHKSDISPEDEICVFFIDFDYILHDEVKRKIFLGMNRLQ